MQDSPTHPIFYIFNLELHSSTFFLFTGLYAPGTVYWNNTEKFSKDRRPPCFTFPQAHNVTALADPLAQLFWG